MTTETPPTDPKNAVPQEGAHTTGGESLYNQVTDKVGGPSVRLFDNMFSLGGAVVGGIVGLIIGVILGVELGSALIGLLVGLVLGVIAGVILAGFVLMVIGLVRR